MSPSTQAKILRVLQEHEFERLGGTRTVRVDVRLVAATNRDLAGMVAQGTFREDLYYRLNVVSIEMPPLRDRKDDITALATFFIRRFSGELKKKIDGLDAEAQKLLMRYNWPGNIRELENAIERAMLLTESQNITVPDLLLGERAAPGSREGATAVKIPPTGIPLEEIERSGADRGAEDVELGAEGCRRTALDQPPRDELQDQDARDRVPARPPCAIPGGRSGRVVTDCDEGGHIHGGMRSTLKSARKVSPRALHPRPTQRVRPASSDPTLISVLAGAPG